VNETADDRETTRSGSPAVTARLLRRWVEREAEARLPVGGTSMAPTIGQPGEVLLVPASRPRRGEVWAFGAASGEVLVHRCRGTGPAGSYRFRGDALITDDTPVPADRLVGRVRRARDARGERSFGVVERVVVAARRLPGAVGRRIRRRPHRR
jgi:hypothetical protein